MKYMLMNTFRANAFTKDSDVQVTWVNNSTLEIKFADNSTDRILLSPSSNIPGQVTPCLFSGSLKNDPKSTVAVSGCSYSLQTSMTISSQLLPEGLIDLVIVNGTTYEDVEDLELNMNGFENDAYQPKARMKRQAFTNEGQDVFIAPRNPTPVRSAFTGPLPAKVSLKTAIKYDISLKENFGNSDSQTKDWINRVVELTKPRMMDSSINLPIEIKVGKVDFLNRRIKADGASIRSLRPNSLTSYFCKDLGGGTVGVAYLETACRTDGFGVNINELFTLTNSELATARVFAHELGHNIGME